MRGNISGRKYIAFAIPVVPAAKVWSKKTLAACTQGAFCSGTLNLWTSVWDEEEEEEVEEDEEVEEKEVEEEHEAPSESVRDEEGF